MPLHLPVLLGMNNPVSADPAHALYPHPPGCTGWRIWDMLHERTGATRSQYLRAFERVNLLDSLTWDRGRARERVDEVVAALAGREVVVFGEEPRKLVGLTKLLIHPQEHRGATWRQLPHPSGRCHWYNDLENRAMAASLLAELYGSVPKREYS